MQFNPAISHPAAIPQKGNIQSPASTSASSLFAQAVYKQPSEASIKTITEQLKKVTPEKKTRFTALQKEKIKRWTLFVLGVLAIAGGFSAVTLSTSGTLSILGGIALASGYIYLNAVRAYTQLHPFHCSTPRTNKEGEIDLSKRLTREQMRKQFSKAKTLEEVHILRKRYKISNDQLITYNLFKKDAESYAKLLAQLNVLDQIDATKELVDKEIEKRKKALNSE